MLRPIPNQPVNFAADLVSSWCSDPRIPIDVKGTDIVTFQFGISRCDTYSDLAPVVWGTSGWDLSPSINNGVQQAGTVLCMGGDSITYNVSDTSFTPTLYQVYYLSFTVISLDSPIAVVFGGNSWTIIAPGDYEIVAIAMTTQKLGFALTEVTGTACLGVPTLTELTEAGTDFAVEVRDAWDDSVIQTLNIDTTPANFSFDGADIVTVNIPLSAIENLPNCFYIAVTQTCWVPNPPSPPTPQVTSELCSQPFQISECQNTVRVRACNDTAKMGFNAGVFYLRVPGALVRPRWNTEVKQERGSDGVIRRTWADRTSTIELATGMIDGSLHPFLSALAVFDHVYVEDNEYMIEGGGYDPSYGDSMTSSGSVSIAMRPAVEMLRNVACSAPGRGCAPADDPICAVPQATVEYTIDITRVYLTVNIFGVFGFQPGGIQVWVDGVNVDGLGYFSPGAYGPFGPYDRFADVSIIITNVNDPDCNWTWQLPYGEICEGEGFAKFTVGTAGTCYVLIQSSDDQYGTLVPPSGVPATFDAGTYYEFTANAGDVFCLFQSTSEGTPQSGMTFLELSAMHLTGIDVTQVSTLETIVVSYNDLTSLVLSNNAALKQIVASNNNISTVSWPAGASELTNIDFSNNNITSLFLMDPALWSDGGVCSFENNSLDATSVNDVLQSADASGKVNGYLTMFAGTNAAPTGAGITAKANLITKGWSVLTN